MASLWILKGLPASGKSSWAKQFMAESGNAIRVNRDLLRVMLHNDKWTPRNEDVTLAAAKALVELGLSQNKTVIVDETNMNHKVFAMWQEIGKQAGAKVQVKSFLGVPVEECVTRDAARGLAGGVSVGKDVIRQMALRSGLVECLAGSVVLCDLDGTLADISHRLPLVKGDGKPNWKAFFEAIPQDALRQDVWANVRRESKGRTLILVSARPATYKDATVRWLDDHGIHYYTLLMRREGDHREDSIVKREMFYQHFGHMTQAIKCVFDDRPRVIRMWRELGLVVHDVGPGVEF